MTRIVFRKEFAALLNAPRFRWASLIFLLLLGAALSNGISYYQVESQRRNAAAEASYDQWLNQGEKNPHSAAHYGFYAYKPVSSLAILDKGLDDYLGNAVWLEAHNQNESKARNAADNIGLSRFGDLTVGMVLSLFVPLLIILLGYNTISDEKENGTLRMMLSTRASGRQLLTGKMLALFAISSIWLVTAVLILGTALALAGINDGARTGVHLLIITGLLLITYATVAMGITSLSAWNAHSATSLVSGISLWIAMAIFFPRLIGAVADSVHPVPSAFAFQQAIDFDKENGLDGHNPASERGQKFKEEILKKYGVDSISQLPVNFAGLSLQAGEEEGNKVYDKHFSALRHTLSMQDKTIDLLTVFSPLMAQQNLLQGLGETDLDRQNLFTVQAESRRREIQKLLNGDYARGGAGKQEYLRGVELWKQVSNFRFNPPQTVHLLARQALNLLVLAAWLLISIGCFVLSYKSLKPFA